MGFLYVIIGLLGGVLSGMGMGGGTILIPLLTTILGVCQKQAQFLNIISFLFMAIFVVWLNIKNKMVSVFPAIIFSLPGIVTSFISAFLVKGLSENFLKITFGIFLIILAVMQLINLIIKSKSDSKQKK